MSASAETRELRYKTQFGLRLHDETFERCRQALRASEVRASPGARDELWECRWIKRLDALHEKAKNASTLGQDVLDDHGLTPSETTLTLGGVRVVLADPLLQRFAQVLVEIDAMGTRLLLLYLLGAVTDEEKDAVAGDLEDAVQALLREIEATR